MARPRPIWPPFAALDEIWQSPQGQVLEMEKARRLDQALAGQLMPRPRVLILGAVSDPVQEAIAGLKAASLIQAYPPALGVRPGPVPCLLMDSDLPPFSSAHFDLVLISHTFEYRRFPLALLSLAYEIIQAQGRLALITPHPLLPEDLCAGYSSGYWGWQVRSLLSESAFTPTASKTAHLASWRPAYGIHVAQPQVPPRPGRPLIRFNPVEALRRLRGEPGIAVRRDWGQRRPHD